MKLVKTATAGTVESSDILVSVEPRENGGIILELQSPVIQQFGRQIEKVIRETLSRLEVENAVVRAMDRGALDCTIRARVSAAVFRAAEKDTYSWEALLDD